MKPTLYTSALSHKHDTGAGHPESSARIAALEDLFQTAPFKDWPQKTAHAAELDTILLAHDEDYIFNLQDKTPDQGLFYLDGDTVLSPASYDAALHAAGAVCDAVDDVINSTTSLSQKKNKRPRACTHDGFQNARAFCATRPPGHHAEPTHALGFCLMNNIFIGAKHALNQYAQSTHNIKKIAIIDFDVHHGNGTETMCRAHNNAHPDTPIFYISTHGHPLFPHGIHGGGDPAQNDDTTLNIHLPDKCTSAQFRNLYEGQVFPTLDAFAPDLLMLSAGFDAHKNDPLASAALETADYGWLTRHLCDIATKHSKGRVVSVLEGGYDIPALTDSVTAHLKELAI